MKLKFLFVGSNKGTYIDEGINLFNKRIKRFSNSEIQCTPNIRGIKKPSEQREKEATQLLKHIDQNEFVILLDEKGRTFNSVGFAKQMETLKNRGTSKIAFIICGAFGAHKKLLERANLTLSLSDFTFSHQLARIVLLEQVYRAFTIINNHPYHNEG
jgi:23S rRNA (pseudouridine1915-N3)-methyltransferase